MEQALLPTTGANRKGNLRNERTYLLWLVAPGPQSLRVAGLVQHRIDRGFARSIQAVRLSNNHSHQAHGRRTTTD